MSQRSRLRNPGSKNRRRIEERPEEGKRECLYGDEQEKKEGVTWDSGKLQDNDFPLKCVFSGVCDYNTGE